MDMDLAIVVSIETPICVINKLGSEVPVEARLSDLMLDHWIRVRTGDLVAADFQVEPPKVLYRWWRATVVTVEGDELTIRPLPSREDTKETGTATVMPGTDIQPKQGDVVFAITNEAREPVLIDVGKDGEPAHPERFLQHYPHIEQLYAIA